MLRIVSIGLLATSCCLASITTYEDFATWQTAVLDHPGALLLSETFAGGRINTPGLTLTPTSGPGQRFAGGGHIANEAWVDCVGKLGCAGGDNDETTLRLRNGGLIYGLWFPDFSVTNESLKGLQFYLDIPDRLPEFVRISGPAIPDGGFEPVSDMPFGFTTDEPFTNALFASDLGSVSFTIRNGLCGGQQCAISIGDPGVDTTSDAPEPTVLLPVGLAVLLVYGGLHNRTLNPKRLGGASR